MIKHIIHKQQVFLKVGKMDEALNFQSSVSSMFNNELGTRLEDVFNEIAPRQKTIRLDTLRVDLGVINSASFEQDFMGRLIEKIREEISKRKQEISIQKNEDQDNDTSVVTQAQSNRDALIYFLQFGSLPWYAVSKKTGEWEKEIVAGFSKTDWAFFVKWLEKSSIKNDVICRRLVWQFSDVFLSEIFSKGLAERDPDVTHLYHDLHYLLTAFLKQSQSEARNDIWTSFLNYFIVAPEKLAVPLVIIKLFVLKLTSPQLQNFTSALEKIDPKIETKDVRKVLVNLLRLVANEKQKHIDRETKEFDVGSKGDENRFDLKLQLSNRLVELLSTETQIQSDYQNKSDEEDRLNELLHSHEKAAFTSEKNIKVRSLSPEDAFYISTSGLVLLHPFLEAYFTELELMENGKFLSEALHSKAVLLLNYLATGNEEMAEFNLTLEKIMCGFPLEETLPAQIELTTEEKDESAKLLQSVIDYWPPLKNTSIQGLQSSFLQRDGKLTLTDSGWLLVVEQKTLDVLLGKLPWGFSTIRLKWMKEMLSVEWD